MGPRFRPCDGQWSISGEAWFGTSDEPGVDAASPCTRPAESYTTSMASASNRRLAVEEFVKRLRQGLTSNMLDVRLFGSEARGEATSESDIDVLVVVQPDTDRVQLEDRIIDIAFDVNLDFGVYISPRVVTPGILNDPVWRETPFIKNVAQDSIPL
jgi:predicted nucleotidyltransferase